MQILRCASLIALPALVATTALAQWSSDPTINTPVCVQPGDQAVPKIAASGDGSTWLGWFDNRSGGYAVYVQLLDRDGNAVFATDGLLVSSNPQNSSLVDWDLVSDGAGGAVLVFTDARAGSDLDVYAYRISSTGQFLWGPNGVALSSNADFEPSPRCAALSDGSFGFVWSNIPSSGTGSIRVQKLDALGAPQFAADGLPILGATNEKPGFADVVAGDAGSMVVSYVRNIATFLSLRHLYAQKVTSAGSLAWNGGNPVVVFDATVLSIAYWPRIEPDGAGGAVLAWHRANGNFFDSFVQHLSSAGAELFPHNGVAVSLEANVMKLDPSIAYLPASGDTIVAFNRRNTNQSQWGVGAQRISSTGARLWSDDGVALAALDGVEKSFERSVPFGDGAVVAYFDNPATPLPNARVIAMRVDANGALVWGPVIASTAAAGTASKDDLELAMDASGLLRATWDDNRTDPGGDIYAQDVHVDGMLGIPTTCTAATYCVGAPNSVGPGASIGWSGSTSLALNNLVLGAGGCPPTVSAIFFYGPNATAGNPFKNGLLCTNGGLRRLPILTTDATGSASFAFDAISAVGPVTGGSTWHFQLWYRDAAAPPYFTNTSDALAAQFCP